jgi:hypothetical protein
MRAPFGKSGCLRSIRESISRTPFTVPSSGPNAGSAWQSIQPPKNTAPLCLTELAYLWSFLSEKAFCYKGEESGVIEFREKNEPNFSHGSWFSTCGNPCGFV